MNINSKIDWQVGLELTEQTFKGQDVAVEGRISALRSALNSGQFGLLPDSEYNNHATFVKRNLEISNLKCMVLMRSGQIIHVDESVVMPMTMLYEDLYYVTVSLDEENLTHFNYQGVPMVRPSNKFSIVTAEQLLQSPEQFPFVKLRQADGSFAIDVDYIPPVVMIGSSSRVMESLGVIVGLLDGIAAHPNLELGEATIAVRRLLFMLKAVTPRCLMSELVSLLGQLSHVVDYYVIKPNSIDQIGEGIVLDFNDIGVWIKWFITRLETLSGAMDSIVLEDRSVDYEKLKGELYAQLSDMLRGDLYKQLHDQLALELREEIARDVKSPLMSFITGEVRLELYDELSAKLMRSLDEKLSPELYDKLYNALYVEEEVVDDEFTPSI